jgi:REP element-mobilizing transposase RayT
MTHTYTQVYVHLVFGVGDRNSRISTDEKSIIEQYICGIVTSLNSTPLAVYCNPDHCHLLVGLHPQWSISDLAKIVKTKSSKWLNERRKHTPRFHWQSGYGAFTCHRSKLKAVIQYIRNQHEHHRFKTFREEFIEFLKAADVEYDERYLFYDVV